MSKKAVIFAVRTAVSVGILAVLLHRLDWHQLSGVLRGIRPGYVALAPVCLAAAFLFGAVRWHTLLSAMGISQSVRRCYAIYLIGHFYNMVLPGAISGDAIRISLCALNARGGIGGCTFAVLLERAGGMASLFVLGAVGALVISPAMADALGGAPVRALPAVAAGILAAGGLCFWVGRRIPARLYERRGRFIARAGELASRAASLTPRVLASFFVCSALFQMSDIVGTYFIARSLGVVLPFTLFLVVVPVVFVATLLPISLGGLGVREGAFVYLLGLVGVDASSALALSLLVYCNRLLLCGVGGLLNVTWNVRGSGAALPR